MQSKPVVKVEAAPTQPSSSGGCASPVYTGRVRDRQRAAIETQPIVQQASTHVPDAWEIAYNKRQDESKAEETRRQRAAEEKRHVAACHEAAAARDKADADAHAQRVVEQMFSDEARRQVKHILSDCTGEEIQEILRRVDAARMKGFAPAYQTFKDEVRRERRKS
jgi:hypothetical protein